ncbi:MAG: endonuclease Q family protein [Candidatus Aenigmatarchaeota archaeon]
MEIIADLHIHSHYSRATSPNMEISSLARGAREKGLQALGTGDFTHPKWFDELKKTLSEDDGVYSYDGVYFVPTAEISLIYSQKSELDKKNGRRVHIVILAPNFEVAGQIKDFLGKIGRLDYDGRPIFARSCIEIVDALMHISKDIEIIPAHVWTPWFSLFGSMSGFNSLQDCFKDTSKYIHSIETGMSSDPAMNRMLSQLDGLTLTSFSDAHSPYTWRIGREAIVIEMKNFSYKNIIDAIRARKNFLYTIETNPAYGKYHEDGHRNCGVHMTPEESRKHKNICPVCKRPLTIGVMSRVEELADRPFGYKPKDSIPFKSLLPLQEIIAAVLNSGLSTKKVYGMNEQFMKLGNELDILMNVEEKDLRNVDGKVADLIMKMRNGKLKIIPGYDGVYGKLISDDKDMKQKTFVKKEKSLLDF